MQRTMLGSISKRFSLIDRRFGQDKTASHRFFGGRKTKWGESQWLSL